MKLKILSFNGESFSHNDVHSATLMTANGEITLLDNHEKLITAIRPTTLELKFTNSEDGNNNMNFALGSGLIEVSDNEVKVMTDMLVDPSVIDVDQIEQARKKALATMEKYKNAKDRVDMEKFIDAEDQLLKYVAQIKLYKLDK